MNKYRYFIYGNSGGIKEVINDYLDILNILKNYIMNNLI